MNKEKLVISVYLDNKTVLYSDNMPEVLKKHFKSTAVTVNTLKQLTNNKEFNNIECRYVEDSNDINKKNMYFTFEGNDLSINVTSPIKKETLPLKEDLCFIRDSFLHNFIKENNVVYIIESKPKDASVTRIRLYSKDKLVKEFLIDNDVILAGKLYSFFREEKKLLNNYFKYSNVTKFDTLEDALIIELRDKVKELKYNGIKEVVKKIKEKDSEVFEDEDVSSYDLDELDDLLYQTGLISVKDIKAELKKRQEKESENK